MRRAIDIIRSAAGWLMLVPAGLLVIEMITPTMTFVLLPPGYGLIFGSLAAIHFAARWLPIKPRRQKSAPEPAQAAG